MSKKTCQRPKKNFERPLESLKLINKFNTLETNKLWNVLNLLHTICFLKRLNEKVKFHKQIILVQGLPLFEEVNNSDNNLCDEHLVFLCNEFRECC